MRSPGTTVKGREEADSGTFIFQAKRRAEPRDAVTMPAKKVPMQAIANLHDEPVMTECLKGSQA